MKKIIFLLIMTSMIAGSIQSQVKVNFSLSNARIENNLYTLDVIATVPAGQVWKAGPTNIRVGYTTTPDSILAINEDNPATNANINITANSNYAPMTTTSILTGSAVSLNIFNENLRPSYHFTTGTYVLGAVRWNIIKPGIEACIDPTILQISAVFDSTAPLAYSSGWTQTDTGCIPIAVKQISTEVPDEYKLYQNYPNPFNPTTTIKFDIAKTSNVEITIYDAIGREIARLVDAELKSGTYQVTWDAANYSTGLYFYTIRTKDYTHTNKMVLIK